MSLRKPGVAFAALLVLATMWTPAGPAAAAGPTDEVAQGCDPLDPARCLLPFPNDFYTVEDPTTPTGRRVNIDLFATPRNQAGKPIDPTEWNRNDGFSPGSLIVTYVPGLDFEATGSVPITDIARYADADAPVLLVDAETGERHPIWTEPDSNATGDSDRTLLIHPAVNLTEGHRYIVALRDMKDASGATIAPGAAFQAYIDGRGTDAGERQTHMDSIFTTLEGAGVDPSTLFLTWDFTVASEENLSERLLHIRDDAFSSLGDDDLSDLVVEGESPAFTVDHVQDFSPEESAEVARRVEGTVTVPLYLNQPSECAVVPDSIRPLTSPIPEVGGAETVCNPVVGSRFNYLGSDDGLPTRPGGIATMHADYICNIPRAAFGADGEIAPASPALYGHGLLGGNGEVNAGNVKAMGNEHDFMFCATDWIGMATEDIPNVASILVDMSNFPSLADRAQQGMLNFLFLGRAMIHPNGFASDPAFQQDGASLIDTERLFYDGNSQGGIMGGALTAVAPDFTDAVLGVPGMNYSTLLNRSSDWDTYSVVAYAAYPDKIDQQIVFSLIQMIWDRAEANGYALHMTDDPYPNTPAHRVLLHEAFGDHQVANVTTEVEARTIGARIYQPALEPGRHSGEIWGIPGIAEASVDEPYTGSALVIWDAGTPTPPTGNVAPEEGSDPHGKPRSQAAARLQKAIFLRDGYFADVCGGAPCKAS